MNVYKYNILVDAERLRDRLWKAHYEDCTSYDECFRKCMQKLTYLVPSLDFPLRVTVVADLACYADVIPKEGEQYTANTIPEVFHKFKDCAILAVYIDINEAAGDGL